MEGLGVGVHHQVGGPCPNPESFEVGDGRVHRIEPQDEVGHHRAVGHGGLEGRRPECLPTEGSVDVGDPEEHELDAGGVAHDVPSGSACLIASSASPMVAAKRSTISASSASVAVKAGASSVWSPV